MSTLQPSAVTFSGDAGRFILYFDLPDGSRANIIATVDEAAYQGAVQTWRNGSCVARYATALEGITAVRKALLGRRRLRK